MRKRERDERRETDETIQEQVDETGIIERAPGGQNECIVACSKCLDRAVVPNTEHHSLLTPRDATRPLFVVTRGRNGA